MLIDVRTLPNCRRFTQNARKKSTAAHIRKIPRDNTMIYGINNCLFNMCIGEYAPCQSSWDMK